MSVEYRPRGRPAVTEELREQLWIGLGVLVWLETLSAACWAAGRTVAQTADAVPPVPWWGAASLAVPVAVFLVGLVWVARIMLDRTGADQPFELCTPGVHTGGMAATRTRRTRPAVTPASPEPIASATVGHYTVSLLPGVGEYLTHVTAYDGAVYGDAMAMRLEDETAAAYCARWAAALADPNRR